ncbi:DUF6283 family protein [Nocardia wallacei]|uniref:DUF6283 family protein n=1 Tax=Nocardia wallacei TaxID=480035 RepID=UPI002457DD45|nr:DUF6283 family protein [Nocardia wallacei]
MIRPPAPRPCASCPYRRDVPSGIWAAEEYAKLPAYDRPTMEQPPGVFLCHQNDRGSAESRVCGGWAGCHDGYELLSIRFAMMHGEMDAATAEAICEYQTSVALFASGAAAAEHGIAEIEGPSSAAVAAIQKVRRRRDLTFDR